MHHPNETIMKRAITIAKEHYLIGGYAVAAVIVRGDAIIAEAFTTIWRDNNATYHAEMNAITIAAKTYGRKLHECYLYTTYEPCPMCTSAALWSQMKGIVYGAHHSDATETHPWRIVIPAKEVIERSTRKIELYENVLRDECKKLLLLDGSI